MGFVWKCLGIAVLAFFADVVATVHIIAIGGAAVAPAVATIIVGHFLHLADRIAIIDHPQLGKRLWLTGASAFGAGAGCAVSLML